MKTPADVTVNGFLKSHLAPPNAFLEEKCLSYVSHEVDNVSTVYVLTLSWYVGLELEVFRALLCSPTLNTTSVRFGSARPCPCCQKRLQVKYFLLGRSTVGACGKVAEFTAAACFLPHGCVYYPDLYVQ
ncbi:hypothetical protein Baya_3317 [Bagarius yarrelli]|uniref:Uncharacterized protein n=1 Tax=Bagarius yarrelli TaxID=175774 RepID=A0A556TSA8_BAGYA|nr:hypothetical protein Baya_3317 [Bagarius yarrelli]